MQKIDNEVWKPVPGYEGLYEASDLGNVRSLNYNKTGKTKILKPGISSSGYLRVGLWKKGEKRKEFLVQRLIYSVFKGPIPPGMTVDHINNVRTDNRPENLQLLTRAENTRKARKGKSSWMKGKKHTEETKAKISTAKKGRKLSEETKAKMKGKTPWLGKKHTEETKRKISASKKGQATWLGKKHTEETKAKISAAHKGRIPWNKGRKLTPLTEEIKAKISATQKARYQREKNLSGITR